jgi:nitroreductase
MNVNEVLFQHRSIRNYKNEPIDEQVLNEIFLAGCRASTTGNMQVYSIINTTDQEIKEKLAPAHFNQRMILTTPNVLTICADFNRFKKWCLLNNAIPGYDNFLSFMTAAIDALLVAQNIVIAAEDKGLGICYLGTTLYNADKIIDILELPKGVIPITTLTIGWPDEFPPITDRLPLNAIIHKEVYHDYLDDSIYEIYSEKESLQDNLNFVRENKKETLAQVFTDVRYKKVDNDFFSEKLLSVLKQQGFI